MNIDLHDALGTLAESGARRTAPTEQLLARVHRRRTARAVTTGAVSMGTVAAVALGAVALDGRGPATGVATAGATTTEPTTEPSFEPSTSEPPPGTEPTVTGDGLNCGSWAPDTLVAEVGGVGLDVQLPATWREGDPFVLSGQVDATDATELANQGVIVSLMSGGTVKASGGTTVNLATEGGRLTVGTPFLAELVLEPCGDERLPAGEYTAIASMLYDVGDGRSGLLQVGAPIVVTEWTSEPADEAAAQAAVAAIIAAAHTGSGGAPGTCGSTLVPGALEDSAVRVGLSMTPRPERPRPQHFYGHSTVDNVGPQLVESLTSDALIVLTRDGVVVATGEAPGRPAGSDPIQIEPGSSWGLTTAEWFEVCGLPGGAAPEVRLPAGDYQAWAVLSASVTDLDGPAAGTTRDVTVVSAPVDVTYD